MLTTVIAAFIVIGVIVFVHELGHFVAAKLSGVRVETFSLGLGPRLWGERWGETDYVLSAIPFGGYVKMEGESPEEDEDDAVVEYGERSFLGKNKGIRALIVAAGPAMNFVLAIVIYGLLTAWMGEAVFTTKVVGVVDGHGPAWTAGLRQGDVVQSVGAQEPKNWDDFLDALGRNLGRTVEVTVKRGGRDLVLNLDLRSSSRLDSIGIERYIPPVADSVASGSPAALAGIKPGDRITEIGGQKIFTWQDLARLVEPSPGRALDVTWMRDGKAHSSTVTPEDFGGIGKLGIVNDYRGEYELRKVGLFTSIKRGIRTAAWMSVQFLKLPRLLMEGVPLKEVIGGPVRIGELAGETIRLGAGTFLAFIAALSAQLSVVNLLPIPVLDGGHLLLLGVETVARRPISTRQRIIAQQIGLALLVALMLFVTMVDVSRLLGG
jgi:regulator of sigma E protease